LCGSVLGAGCLYLYERQSCADVDLLRHDHVCPRLDASSASYRTLEGDVRDRVARMQADGTLTRAAVRFQRLRDGAGFGVNDDATFAPASMLKLPFAFAMFQLERQSPGTLGQEMPYTPERVRNFTIPRQIEVEPSGLQPGQTCTIEALMRAAVTYSDNLAYYLLVQFVNEDPARVAVLTRTFREVGVTDPRTLEDPSASVREYAGLFRLLYNTSYLDAAASEKLLLWLKASGYRKGIAAGTPAGVAVANKFGERVAPDGTHQLHDCGIVYRGDDPYVLCIMTQGTEFGALRRALLDVSRTVYAAEESRTL
jgi:hypothetical protein